MQESVAKPRDPLDEYAEWNRLDVNENAIGIRAQVVSSHGY
jgi:hypothetical protein